MQLKVLLKTEGSYRAETIVVQDTLHLYCKRSCPWLEPGKLCGLTEPSVKLVPSKNYLVWSAICQEARSFFISTPPRHRTKMVAGEWQEKK